MADCNTASAVGNGITNNSRVAPVVDVVVTYSGVGLCKCRSVTAFDADSLIADAVDLVGIDIVIVSAFNVNTKLNKWL